MDWTEIAKSAIEVGGPAAIVTAVLSAGLIWLINRILSTALEAIKKIGEDCHKNLEDTQIRYQKQIDSLAAEQKIVAREVMSAVADNTKALIRHSEAVTHLESQMAKLA
jgi:hypothetical protein